MLTLAQMLTDGFRTWCATSHSTFDEADCTVISSEPFVLKVCISCGLTASSLDLDVCVCGVEYWWHIEGAADSKGCGGEAEAQVGVGRIHSVQKVCISCGLTARANNALQSNGAHRCMGCRASAWFYRAALNSEDSSCDDPVNDKSTPAITATSTCPAGAPPRKLSGLWMLRHASFQASLWTDLTTANVQKPRDASTSRISGIFTRVRAPQTKLPAMISDPWQDVNKIQGEGLAITVADKKPCLALQTGAPGGQCQLSAPAHTQHKGAESQAAAAPAAPTLLPAPPAATQASKAIRMRLGAGPPPQNPGVGSAQHMAVPAVQSQQSGMAASASRISGYGLLPHPPPRPPALAQPRSTANAPGPGNADDDFSVDGKSDNKCKDTYEGTHKDADCNLKSQTIEEIVAHRQKEVLAMLPYLDGTLRRDVPCVAAVLIADLEEAAAAKAKPLVLSSSFASLATSTAITEVAEVEGEEGARDNSKRASPVSSSSSTSSSSTPTYKDTYKDTNASGQGKEAEEEAREGQAQGAAWMGEHAAARMSSEAAGTSRRWPMAVVNERSLRKAKLGLLWALAVAATASMYVCMYVCMFVCMYV